MRSPRVLLLACVLLVVAGCGATRLDPSATMALPGAEPAAHQALAGQQIRDFGREYDFPGGLRVLVSTPRSFSPSASAYPRCSRAVAFEVNLSNDSTVPYRLSALNVSATISDEPVKQVVDSAQGFTGNLDAGRDLAPGRNVRLNVAFAMPDEPAPLRITVRPDVLGGDRAVYEGRA